MTTEPNEAEHTYWLTLKTDPAVTYLARGRAGLPNTYWVGYADVAEEFDYGGAAPHGYAYTHDPEAPPEGGFWFWPSRV